MDADDADWTAYERQRLVRSALTATLSLDESIVQARIPLPIEVLEESSVLANIRPNVASMLDLTLEKGRLLTRGCTIYGHEDEPVPRDLEPWSRHCTGMFDVLVESVCEAEINYGLPASVPCGGTRTRRRARSSFEELARRGEQAFVLCDLAEEVLDDEAIVPAQRVEEWRGRFDANGIEHPDLLALVDDALAVDERSDAAAQLVAGVRSLLSVDDWECAAFEALLEDGTE